MWIFLIVAAAIVLIWVISNYNFFVTAKTRIGASVQEIGNQLKRQADLIPNLEESAKGYLKHEKGVYESLTDARKAIVKAAGGHDVQQMADAGAKLASILPQITAVFESNPELKGSEVVSKLMEELTDTADKIMYARRLVIDLTADYNVKRVTLPSNIVASIFHFDELPGIITPVAGEHLSVSSEETKSPKVKF
jgi:LemA protein